MLRTLIILGAAIGLSGALLAGPAIAHHKPNHNAGAGGGGGDATYTITLTNDRNGVVVAAGDGVGGPGGTIDGITEVGSFEFIALGSIETQSGASDVRADYDAICGDNENVNIPHESEAIESIRVVHDAEIDTLTVPVDYTVTDDATGATQPFVLLLQGPYSGEFPPTETVDLTIWNNRGGGKGKKNRCGTGPQSLDLVTLEIELTAP